MLLDTRVRQHLLSKMSPPCCCEQRLTSRHPLDAEHLQIRVRTIVGALEADCTLVHEQLLIAEVALHNEQASRITNH